MASKTNSEYGDEKLGPDDAWDGEPVLETPGAYALSDFPAQPAPPDNEDQNPGHTLPAEPVVEEKSE